MYYSFSYIPCTVVHYKQSALWYLSFLDDRIVRAVQMQYWWPMIDLLSKHLVTYADHFSCIFAIDFNKFRSPFLSPIGSLSLVGVRSQNSAFLGLVSFKHFLRVPLWMSNHCTLVQHEQPEATENRKSTYTLFTQNSMPLAENKLETVRLQGRWLPVWAAETGQNGTFT